MKTTNRKAFFIFCGILLAVFCWLFYNRSTATIQPGFQSQPIAKTLDQTPIPSFGYSNPASNHQPSCANSDFQIKHPNTESNQSSTKLSVLVDNKTRQFAEVLTDERTVVMKNKAGELMWSIDLVGMVKLPNYTPKKILSLRIADSNLVADIGKAEFYINIFNGRVVGSVSD